MEESVQNPNESESPGTKQCPFCLADVPQAAVKCRHCASDFRGSTTQQMLSKAGNALQIAKRKSEFLFDRETSPFVRILDWFAPNYEKFKTTAKSASEVTVNDVTLMLVKRHKSAKDAVGHSGKRWLMGLGLLPVLFVFLVVAVNNKGMEFLILISLLVGAADVCLYIPWYTIRLIVAWSEKKGINLYIEHIAEKHPPEASFLSVAAKEALPRFGSWLAKQAVKRVLHEVERELRGE